MTLHDRVRRAVGAVSIALLAAGLLAGPASAAPAIRWVDDDGKAGLSSCDSNRTAAFTILDALLAAGPGDIIKVCPGTYPGFLSVTTPRVSIISVKPRKAVVRPPMIASARVAADPVIPLVSVGANRVTIQGLRINAGTTESCWSLDGIAVGGFTGVKLRGNRIDGRSDGSSITCGLKTGINATLTARSQTLTIARNLVRNHRDGGIATLGGTVTVTGNTVVWAHGPQTTTTGIGPAGFTLGGPAIETDLGKVTVRGNRIVRDPAAPLRSVAGILVGAGTGTVAGNRIDGIHLGIAWSNPVRGRITGNVVRNGSADGLYVVTFPTTSAARRPAVEIDHNQVHGFTDSGIHLVTTQGFRIHHNDARNNPGVDCKDDTIPTQNDWAWGTRGHNLGNDQNQAHLCRKPRR